MRFSLFQKKMLKGAFTFAEARIVAHEDSPEALRLNIHRWVKKGGLLRIRRGVFAFPDRAYPLPEMVSALYPPAYVSLESALSQGGLLPDAAFETTLVTPRATRSFDTVWGRFHFHHIQPRLFFGYDPKTLLAEPEKALLDYLYFRKARLSDEPAFWREARFQNLETIDWDKGGRWRRLYPDGKLERLWRSLRRYAKTHRAD
ncbi:MAG: hypothetical protein WC728_07555 [Elusimicrobiota bacterium]